LTHDHHRQQFPKAALLGAAALISVSLGLVAMSRHNDVGATRMPVTPAVTTRELRFEDMANGGITVYDARAERVVTTVQPGTNGFLRGVLRSLARERRREQVGALPPFQLTRWADGRLSIEDPMTGERVNLEVFGPTNVAVFAQLLTTPTSGVPGVQPE
jgi:putative photosynthetic complex assembly protein